MTDTAPPSQDRPAPARRASALVGSAARLKSAILAANAVAALLLVAVIGLQAAADRRATVESAYRNVENLTEVLAEHTRQTLQGLDLGIRTIAEAAQLSNPASAHDQALLHEVLANRQRGSSATFAFFVLDAQGRLLATSRALSPRHVDLSGYPEFTVHRDRRDAGLFLGFPRKGRVGYAEGRWIVNLTRRIDRADGSFGGIVAASLSLDYLLDFYRALSIGAEGALGLMSRDGVLIVRAPFDERLIGRDMSASAWFEQQIRRIEKGRFTGRYATDGIERLSAHEWVVQRQAVVYVGMGIDEILAPWRKRLLFQSAIGLLAMALLAIASWMVWRHVLRERRWQEERSQRLRAIARASADLVASPDVEGALQRAAELARTLLGADCAVALLHRGSTYPGGDLQALSASQGCAQVDASSQGDGRWLLTQAEIDQDAEWQWLRDRDTLSGATPGRWLAVPMRSQDGHALGALELCGKQSGEFSEDDVSEATQLASVAAAVLENLASLREREAALAEANRAKAQLETVFTSISDAVYALDRDWRFVYLNDEAQRLLNRDKAGLLGKKVWDEFPEAKDTALHANYLRVHEERVPVTFEFLYPPLAAWFSVRAFPQEQGGLTAYFHDITARVETEARLRQSQKMDAIGQLTGGVAHDFNNLLTVILGAADEIVENAGPGDRALAARGEIIRKAGERAAALTHRLLAFARKQPLEPRLTNVNELLADFEDLLRRTLGEQVEVELVRGAGLWKALVDPHELQNAILNLAINARDAMPEGGRLTIETANVSVDHDYAQAHQMTPGQYVQVAVSDTGHGMPPETLARAFDPFFTTKPTGKGSGLGLSMVYGFVRQSGGQARIYSEPGHGTTVRLYLPREHAADEVEYRRPESSPVVGGDERVLVVEDDELVRMLAVASLERLGYRATACDSGRAALELLEGGAEFDLLLTDIVLGGGMSGKQVASEALRRAPQLKVLFMSGYTENAIVHHGRLDRGVHLLGKPFRLADLARKVREVLDEA